MTDSLSGWSPTGIVAGICLTLGILMLVVYAAQRGLVNRELDGTDDEAAALAADDPTATRKPVRRQARRSIGALGALLLATGLVLGALFALGGWGAASPGVAGPGGEPQDCAQGWTGCPKATP